MTTPNELPESIRQLIAAAAAEDGLTPGRCKKLLDASSVTPEDLAAWSDYSHPTADSYGRSMVYDGGHFELMVMAWNDGDMAAIHDHGYTQWGAVKMFGAAEHAIFKIDHGEDGCLRTVERRIFSPGETVAVGHDLIHQMGNLGQPPFVSLHLYGAYDRDSNITADANLYDLDEGRVQITSGGVFFALPEEAISRRQAGPRADFPTVLRYKVELLRRLLRRDDCVARGEITNERAVRLAGELFAAATWRRASAELEVMADADEKRRECYADILQQELRATARLQLELLAAGLVDSPFAGYSGRLAKIHASDDPASAFLELVGGMHDIQFDAELLAA